MHEPAYNIINQPGSDRTLLPIGLREDGTTAQLLFPTDLTKAEAEKISRIVLAYANGGPELPTVPASD